MSPRRILFGSSLFVATIGLVAISCQGPDQLNRNAAVGLTGTGGTIGSAGTTGAAGTTGRAGTNGAAGTTGITGIAGTTGRAGTNGAAGTNGVAGTTGRAGTTGAAGTMGAAGTTGTAGTTGAAGTTGTGGTAGCTGCKVEIQTYCQNGSSPQTINLYADVVNNSTAGLPLSEVTFRYWFTSDETTDPGMLNIDYAAMFPNGAGITSQFVTVSPAATGANEYLEIGFAAGALTLGGFADSGQIQLRFHGAGYSSSFDLSQTDDYSFQACAGANTPNNPPFNNAMTITAYINGALAWGTEP